VLIRLKLSSCPSSTPVSLFSGRWPMNCSMNRMLGLEVERVGADGAAVMLLIYLRSQENTLH